MSRLNAAEMLSYEFQVNVRTKLQIFILVFALESILLDEMEEKDLQRNHSVAIA